MIKRSSVTLFATGMLSVFAASALAQESGISVLAYGSLKSNVGPDMELRVNGNVIGHVEVRSTTPKTYTFPGVSVPAGAKVDVVYKNDAAKSQTSPEDRNLYVSSLTVNGATIAANAPGVVFDRGAGSLAFDGIDVIPGQSGLYWNGALRFVAGAPAAVNAANLSHTVS